MVAIGSNAHVIFTFDLSQPESDQQHEAVSVCEERSEERPRNPEQHLTYFAGFLNNIGLTIGSPQPLAGAIENVREPDGAQNDSLEMRDSESLLGEERRRRARSMDSRGTEGEAELPRDRTRPRTESYCPILDTRVEQEQDVEEIGREDELNRQNTTSQSHLLTDNNSSMENRETRNEHDLDSHESLADRRNSSSDHLNYDTDLNTQDSNEACRLDSVEPVEHTHERSTDCHMGSVERNVASTVEENSVTTVADEPEGGTNSGSSEGSSQSDSSDETPERSAR